MRTLKRLTLLPIVSVATLAASAFLAGIAASAATATPGWSLEPLPVPLVTALDVNNSGTVIGIGLKIVKNGTAVSSLPVLPGATSSSLAAINDAGVIVGTSQVAVSSSTTTSVLTLWTGTAVAQSTPAVATAPGPLDINESGQVVGTLDTGAQPHAFVWSPGQLVDLGTFGGVRSAATSINDLGVIVGTTTDGSSLSHVFVRYPDGSSHVIGLPPGFTSVIQGLVKVNNAGQVIYTATAGPVTQAFIWQASRATAIAPSGCVSGDPIAVYDINSTGQVIGSCSVTTGRPLFVWTPGGTTFLPLPQGQAPPIRSVTAINDVGDIVGNFVSDATPSFVPVAWHQSGLVWGDVYTTPGYWVINGREWNTTCQPYSTTATRCTATIKATQVKPTATGFVAITDWVFNNLTYTDKASSAWSTNPLAVTGTFTSAGRLWSTTCTPNVTSGPRTCRTYIWATVYGRTALPTGGYTYWQRNQWVFNNMVVLS